ncbi:hypothetical protein NL676_023129 [Syzygium grande]|nr:hypothetical protein NL676_023129 [Syzygium grande]
MAPTTVEIRGLSFMYPGIDGNPLPGSRPLIDDFSLALDSGDCCLLIGSNGTGSFQLKPVFCKLPILVLSVFVLVVDHYMPISASGRRGSQCPVEKMILGVACINPQRRAELIREKQ